MTAKPSSSRVAAIGTLGMMTGMFAMIGGTVLVMLTALFSLLELDLFWFSPSNGMNVTFGLLLGSVVMGLGVLWMVAGAGFLRGRRWWPRWGVAATVLSILGAVAGAGLGFYWAPVGLVAWTIILLYLTRANVSALPGQPCGPAPISSRGQLSASQAVTSLESILEAESNNQISTVRRCQNCGAMVAAGAAVCGYCGAPA